MRCYYEELNIARDASDGDIKTAYRKLALRWHPDKNPNSLDEAKERFQLIQQAYEVLSDQHERAWYDNHREQIIRGKNSDYAENCLDLFQYFTVSCFKSYDDIAGGFYAVYREVFEKLTAEDAEFMDDDEEVSQIPTFGDSQSSYEEVVGPFYAYWQAYCTKKTYTWLCPYDVMEIKDRRLLRGIDKELKKIVQKAKKERNEEVRNLVSFIRKRDRRVHAYRRQLEERAELNRQKHEENRLQQIRKRQKELQEMRETYNDSFKSEYEEQLKQLEQEYDSDSSCTEEDDDDASDQANNEHDDVTPDGEGEEQESAAFYVDDLYCVCCNKAFKNEGAFENHETSKKHRENVQRMKQEMLEEENVCNNAASDVDQDKNESLGDVSADGEEEEDDHNVEEEIANLNINTNDTKQTKKTKKNKRAKNASEQIHLADALEHEDDAIADFILDKTKVNGNSSDSEDWHCSSKKTAKKNKNKKPSKKLNAEITTILNCQEHKTVADAPALITLSPKTPAFAVDNSNRVSSSEAMTSTGHICVTCKSKFDSKNKLFAHLKITKHGVYIAKAKSENSTTNGKKVKGSKRK